MVDERLKSIERLYLSAPDDLHQLRQLLSLIRRSLPSSLGSLERAFEAYEQSAEIEFEVIEEFWLIFDECDWHYEGQSIRQWVEQLGSEKRHKWISAERSMTRLGYLVVPLLAERLGSKEQSIRFRAAEALSSLGPKARPALERLVASIGHCYGYAVRALGVIGELPESAIIALEKAHERGDRGAGDLLKKLRDDL